MVQELAVRYGTARRVHRRDLKDYQEQVLNECAAEWLQTPSGDLTEPWLYLIGDDGHPRPVGTMWSESDVEAALDELPRMTN